MKIYKFKIYGHEYETKVIRREEDEIVISVNGQEYKAYLQPLKKQIAVRPTAKVQRPVAVPSEGALKTAKPTEGIGMNVVKAPIPGLVLKVLVKPGDPVKAGDVLLIMEAMKMQNNISAPLGGKVAEIKIQEGQAILEGQELVTISTI